MNMVRVLLSGISLRAQVVEHGVRPRCEQLAYCEVPLDAYKVIRAQAMKDALDILKREMEAHTPNLYPESFIDYVAYKIERGDYK